MSADESRRRSSRLNIMVVEQDEIKPTAAPSSSPGTMTKRGRLQRGDSLTNSYEYLNARSLSARATMDYDKHTIRNDRLSSKRSQYASDDEEDDNDEQEICYDTSNEKQRRYPLRQGMRYTIYGQDESRNHASKIESVSAPVNQNPEDAPIKDTLNGSYWKTTSDSRKFDEDDEEGQKYSFRNRAAVRREFTNVTQLGGVGGGYATSGKRSGLRGTDEYNRDRPSYREPRLYLGGRLPLHNEDKHKRSSHHSKGRHRSGRHRRHYDSSSESSSDSCSSYSSGGRDDKQFRKHEARRMQQELDSIVPINPGRGLAGSNSDKPSKRDLNRADVHPIVVDSNTNFDSVGGLDSHILALKEMVILPLLYPDVFERFDTQPPRGVLFVGPPGTGKTLMARALANSLTTSAKQGLRSVSFFMRKGADCLSKWVGEGERQLRLLFEQAKKFQPSIIFFDEIDGLAPVRSVKQDQIHASIVSTLLALMDGLDARGQVVVIGATNRPDAIDSALRRPGRFDRELYFPLPCSESRRKILDISTNSWVPPLSEELKSWIVEASVGYCGADIKALCSEATLIAIRRKFPQIYNSDVRLKIDSSNIIISKGDFVAAVQKIIPSSRRTLSQSAKPLDAHMKLLLESQFLHIVNKIKQIFPISNELMCQSGLPVHSKKDNDVWISSLSDAITNNGDTSIYSSALLSLNGVTHSPRMLISGSVGMGQSELANASLHFLESFQIFRLDLNSLLADSNLENPENVVAHRIEEAMKAAPSVIYLPNILTWWNVVASNLKSVIINATENFPSSSQVLWICTISYEEKCHDSFIEENFTADASELLEDLQLMKLLAWFSNTDTSQIVPGLNLSQFLLNHCSKGIGYVQLTSPSPQERVALFHSFFDILPLIPEKLYTAHKEIFCNQMQSLMPVEGLVVDEIGPENSKKSKVDSVILEKDDHYLRELRVFFRASLYELGKDRRYNIFWRPVNPEAYVDYYDIVSAPMDLDTIRMKVDDNFYETKASFMHDIEQISFNARLYNQSDSSDSRGRSIIHAANSLVDVIETHAYNFKKELGYDVFKRCDEIALRRQYSEPRFKDRKIIHPENAKYYEEILRAHRIQKSLLHGGIFETEISNGYILRCDGVENWDCISCLSVNSYTERRCTTCGGRKPPVDFPDPEPPRKKKITVKNTSSSINEDESVVESKQLLCTVADSSSSSIDEFPPCIESRSLSFDDTEFAIALKNSITLASHDNVREELREIQRYIETKSSKFSFSLLLTVIIKLNRSLRDFNSHGCWEIFIKDMWLVARSLDESS